MVQRGRRWQKKHLKVRKTRSGPHSGVSAPLALHRLNTKVAQAAEVLTRVINRISIRSNQLRSCTGLECSACLVSFHLGNFLPASSEGVAGCNRRLRFPCFSAGLLMGQPAASRKNLFQPFVAPEQKRVTNFGISTLEMERSPAVSPFGDAIRFLFASAEIHAHDVHKITRRQFAIAQNRAFDFCCGGVPVEEL